MRDARALGLAAALLCAAAPAHALDIDRIEILSRLGEPLQAQIPITDASAEELQGLRAQLASPTTFARIGLPRPQGAVASLQFSLGRDARGRPVIRVSSAMPVDQEFLTFLVQVEWAQGQLVREYSVALGATPSLPDPVAPQIQAPQQAPGNAIVRDSVPAALDPAAVNPPPPEAAAVPPPEAFTTAEPAPAPPIPLAGGTRPPPAARPAAVPAPIPVAGPAPRPRQARPAATAATRSNIPKPVAPAIPVAPARPAAVVPGSAYTVKTGDNLTGVVDELGLQGATPQQSMLAVLRANPQAFNRGNINLLKQGAILRTPAPAELTRMSAAEAERLVRLQTEQWRSGDIPPVAVSPAASGPAATPAPTPAGASPASGNVARLEIAPTASDGALRPGTQSGAADGSGDALRTDPDVAAADALAVRYTEMMELKARVAELEQQQKQQQKLIELKDSQLASRGQGPGAWPWLLAGLAALVAIGAVVLRRRRARAAAAPARPAHRTDWNPEISRVDSDA